MVKLGLLTDVHYADIPDAGGRCYQDSLAKAREAVDAFQRAKVDAIVHLGDLIDSPPKERPEKEMQYVELMAAVLANPGIERHFLLGNHCVQHLSKGAFLKACGQRKSYYSVDRGGVHLVFLDACFSAKGLAYDNGNFLWSDADVPEAQRRWLENDLKRTKLKTVVFCHQRLDEPKNRNFAVATRAEVRKVLAASGKVSAVFMGHAHENDLQTIDGIRYACLQAVVEGPGVANGAYAVVTVGDDGALTFDGYRQHRSHPLGAKA